MFCMQAQLLGKIQLNTPMTADGSAGLAKRQRF